MTNNVTHLPRSQERTWRRPLADPAGIALTRLDALIKAATGTDPELALAADWLRNLLAHRDHANLALADLAARALLGETRITRSDTAWADGYRAGQKSAHALDCIAREHQLAAALAQLAHPAQTGDNS